MKFREQIQTKSVQMTDPAAEFGLIFPRTDLHELVVDEVRRSLTEAWQLARDDLPELDEFQNERAIVHVDPLNILEPETEDDWGRIEELRKRELAWSEEGAWQIREAYLVPTRAEGFILIAMFIKGPTPYGTRILHELMHHLSLGEEVIERRLSTLNRELIRRGMGWPLRTIVNSKLKTLPVLHRFLIKLKFQRFRVGLWLAKWRQR